MSFVPLARQAARAILAAPGSSRRLRAAGWRDRRERQNGGLWDGFGGRGRRRPSPQASRPQAWGRAVAHRTSAAATKRNASATCSATPDGEPTTWADAISFGLARGQLDPAVWTYWARWTGWSGMMLVTASMPLSLSIKGRGA